MELLRNVFDHSTAVSMLSSPTRSEFAPLRRGMGFKIVTEWAYVENQPLCFSERKFSSTLHDPFTPRPENPSWSKHRFSRLIANNF